MQPTAQTSWASPQLDKSPLVRVFIQKAGAEALAEMDFDRLTALTETAAEDVAQVLMPWLLEMSAGSEDAVENRYKADYPRLPSASSSRLRRRDGIDGPFQMLRSALAAMAEAAPEAVMPFLMTAMAVEFDEVQALVADTLAAGIPALLEEGLAFLLADPRRLQVGHAHLRDAEGVGRMVYGWSSQRLITTMAPHLGRTDAARLRDAIKAWDPYREVAWMESKGSGLRERLRWADELRMPLYEALPDTVIDARRRRQILEWRAQQPRYREEPEDMILTAVGSPMSTDQMVKATDQEIMGMFDAVDDSVDNFTSRRTRGRRRWPNSGGVSQLAQAFLGFGQREPERTFGILERLIPQRHAYVAGAALRALSENENVCPQRLLRVIRDLDDRGFPDFMLVGIGLSMRFRQYLDIRPSIDLASIGLSPVVGQAALRLLALPLAEARLAATRLRTPFQRSLYRPSVLRERPVLAFGEGDSARLRAPLPDLVLLRVTAGLFYDLVGAPSDLRNEIAARFETYACDLLNASLSGLTFSRGGKYRLGKRELDAPDVVCRQPDGVAAVFECKARKMPFSARYSEAPEDEAGVNELVKGVTQLWRYFAHYRLGFLPSEIIRPDAVPVLLTLENWTQMNSDLQITILNRARAATASDLGLSRRRRAHGRNPERYR